MAFRPLTAWTCRAKRRPGAWLPIGGQFISPMLGTFDAGGEGNAWIKLTESGDTISSSTGQIGATYTVNPDCTGTIEFLIGDSGSKADNSAPHYAFVLKRDNTFSFISTIGGVVLIGS